MAKVRFINAAGTGKSTDIEIEPGNTPVQVLNAQNVEYTNGVIRVNGQTVTAEQAQSMELKEGDRVAFAPTQVKGA